MQCFCVGNVTEKKVRNYGFRNVIAAEGNVSNLKELIIRDVGNKNKKFVYVSGKIISSDLDQQLSKEGYDIKRIINYDAVQNQDDNEVFFKDLKLDMPSIVYLLKNSASSFLNYIKLYKSENLWMNTNYVFRENIINIERIKWKIFFNLRRRVLLYKI